MCVTLLRYAEAKRAFDASTDQTALQKQWKGSRLMAAVMENDFDLARERRTRWAQEG